MDCNVCSSWTPKLGCKHKEPEHPYQKLIPAIVSFTHNGNDNIIETIDFREGVANAIKFLKEHINNPCLMAYLKGEVKELNL